MAISYPFYEVRPTQEFLLGGGPASPNQFNPLHLHESLEFVRILDGSWELNIPGRSIPLQPGECALLLPYQIHGYRLTGVGSSRILMFSPSLVPAFTSAMKGLCLEDPFLTLSDPLRRSLSELDRNPYPELFLQKSILYAICHEFYSRCRHIPADDSGSQVRDILQYVQEHCTENITLASTAAHFGYEYQYFSRKFRRLYQMPFSSMIVSFRLDAALHLLEEGERTITEIASLCGFGSTRSFNRSFLQQFGCPPGIYLARRDAAGRQARETD